MTPPPDRFDDRAKWILFFVACLLRGPDSRFNVDIAERARHADQALIEYKRRFASNEDTTDVKQ